MEQPGETPAELSFRRLCRQLQSNNPAVVSVTPHKSLALINERAFVLGEALEGNAFVEFLELDVSCISLPASLRSVANFVRESPSLHFLRIQDDEPTPMKEAIVDALLNATAANSQKAAKTVQLSRLAVGAGFLGLLRSQYINDLSLANCRFQLEPSAIRDAFSQNHSLERLDIAGLQDPDVISSILVSLKRPLLHLHVSLPNAETARALLATVSSQMLTIQDTLIDHDTSDAVLEYLSRRGVKNVALLQCGWRKTEHRQYFLGCLVLQAETIMIHGCGFDASPIMCLVEQVHQCRDVPAKLWPDALPRISVSASYLVLRSQLPGLAGLETTMKFSSLTSQV